MSVQENINEAINHLSGCLFPGGKPRIIGVDERAEIAQAYALIAIAEALKEMNDERELEVERQEIRAVHRSE